MLRRRGRRPLKPCQIANARQDFTDLSPVDEAPAERTREAWSALLPNQDVPLIGEDRRYGYRDEQDDC